MQIIKQSVIAQMRPTNEANSLEVQIQQELAAKVTLTGDFSSLINWPRNLLKQVTVTGDFSSLDSKASEK